MDRKQKEKDERYEVDSVICIREAMVYRATPFLVVSNSFPPPIPFVSLTSFFDHGKRT